MGCESCTGLTVRRLIRRFNNNYDVNGSRKQEEKPAYSCRNCHDVHPKSKEVHGDVRQEDTK